MHISDWIMLCVIGIIVLFALVLAGPSSAPPAPPKPPVEANRAPVIEGRPFTTSCGDWGSVVLYSAGDHVLCDGSYLCRIHDPDGDELRFLWEFSGPDGAGKTVRYTTFTPAGQNITNSWTGDKTVKVVIGWSQPAPPFPFSPKACPPTPPPPEPPAYDATMRCKLSVTDGEETVSIDWFLPIAVGSCS